MVKKTIGLVGFDKTQIEHIKKIFKKISFSIVSKIDSVKIVDKKITALIANNQSQFEDFFFKKKYTFYPNLEWVHVSVAGIDDYLHIIRDLDFKITCGKIIQGQNVSEHCMSLLLYISRNLKDFQGRVKPGKFRRPIELFNKRVLIYGSGGAGLSIAEKCKAFGMHTSCVDTHLIYPLSFIDEKYEDKDLEKIIHSYDVVIISAPLTDITKNRFNKSLLNKMIKNSILINVSRGEIINMTDLLHFLSLEKFLGVGLDVIDKEPIKKNHALFKYSNVIYTHHTAGLTDDRKRRMNLICHNIENYVSNNKLSNEVDKQYGY